MMPLQVTGVHTAQTVPEHMWSYRRFVDDINVAAVIPFSRIDSLMLILVGCIPLPKHCITSL